MMAWAVCTLTVVAIAGGPANPFRGKWYTTIGVITLEQHGELVTGNYGPNGQFPIKSTVKANALTFEYEEGKAKGNAQFLLDASGNAFTGVFHIHNGQRGP
jgi:hypothetical protein